MSMPTLDPPPPPTIAARFTIHGPDVAAIARRGLAYVRGLGAGVYEVSAYEVDGTVDLVRVGDPGREDGGGLEWGCTIRATLSLIAPPAEPPAEEPAPEEPAPEPAPA